MTVHELKTHLIEATNQQAPVLFITEDGRAVDVKSIYIDKRAVLLESEVK